MMKALKTCSACENNEGVCDVQTIKSKESRTIVRRCLVCYETRSESTLRLVKAVLEVAPKAPVKELAKVQNRGDLVIELIEFNSDLIDYILERGNYESGVLGEINARHEYIRTLVNQTEDVK